jgi:hypothetical protein
VLIERVFFSHYESGLKEFVFLRTEFAQIAEELGIELPKNLGDVIYSFRYRTDLPPSILESAPEGKTWIIRPAGVGKYRFALVKDLQIVPNENLAATKVPDSTPGIVAKYSFDDEQSLLARIRYNRLIDILTGVTCYSLQNHLRTTVPEMGQVETDEVYVGVDRRGAHYVFPVQAKAPHDRIGIVQVEQDFGVCAVKFPQLIPRPIAAQFRSADTIALFEFEQSGEGPLISQERHYWLVPPEELTDEDLARYQERLDHTE